MQFLNFKTLGSQLSNALFLESFGRKFANLHNFEKFQFFSNWWFFSKNDDFSWKFENLKKLKFSNLCRFTNFRPNDSRKRAFESWDPKVLKFKYFIVIRPHILRVLSSIEEVWIMWFFMFFKKFIFDPSSIPSEIKGDWGRVKNFKIFKKYKF